MYAGWRMIHIKYKKMMVLIVKNLSTEDSRWGAVELAKGISKTQTKSDNSKGSYRL